MLEFLKRLLWDSSAFERYSRAALIAASIALTTARDGNGVDWWAFGVAFVGGLIGAGDKTLRTLDDTPDAELHQVGVETRPVVGAEKAP